MYVRLTMPLSSAGSTRAGGRGRGLAEAEPAQEADGRRVLPQHGAQQTQPKP